MQHDSLHILRKAIICCTHRVRCIIIQLDGVQNVSEKKLRGLCKISYITYLPPIYDRLLLSPDLRIECTACGGKFDNISARFRVQISSMYRININNNLHTRETTIYFGFYTDHIIIYYIHFKWNRFWAARPPPPCPPEYNMHNLCAYNVHSNNIIYFRSKVILYKTRTVVYYNNSERTNGRWNGPPTLAKDSWLRACVKAIKSTHMIIRCLL